MNYAGGELAHCGLRRDACVEIRDENQTRAGVVEAGHLEVVRLDRLTCVEGVDHAVGVACVATESAHVEAVDVDAEILQIVPTWRLIGKK